MKYLGSTKTNTPVYARTKEKKICLFFFCDKAGVVRNDLHQVMTQNVDHRLYNDIHLLQDEKLLAKLGTGDLIAQDDVYHNACRAAYNRRVERWKLTNCKVEDFHTQIISNLSEWIEQRLSSEDFGMVKFSVVCENYNAKLSELGVT